jgi:putative transport protein
MSMDFLRTLLEQQPLTTLFLTIALGYVVGEVKLKGFSLGVGAVLFSFWWPIPASSQSQE